MCIDRGNKRRTSLRRAETPTIRADGPGRGRGRGTRQLRSCDKHWTLRAV
jgi:hypothetical protein